MPEFPQVQSPTTMAAIMASLPCDGMKALLKPADIHPDDNGTRLAIGVQTQPDLAFQYPGSRFRCMIASISTVSDFVR